MPGVQCDRRRLLWSFRRNCAYSWRKTTWNTRTPFTPSPARPAKSLRRNTCPAGRSPKLWWHSGTRLVDFQEVRLTLGLTHARLAAEEEIARLFPDCEMGAMPPLGNLYGMPVNVQPRHALSHRAHADGRLPQASPPRSHFVGAGGCGVARVVIRRECRAVAGWTRQLSDTPPTVGGTWPERAFPDNWEREVYFAATATLTVWTQRDEMG